MFEFNSKENIKEYLLNFNIFLENEYFDLYVDLVYMNKNTLPEKYKTQTHHIIPKKYFKLNNLSVDNSEQNLVELYYKDHVLAHCYLTLCLNSNELISYSKLAVNAVIISFGFENQKELVENLDIVQKIYETSATFSDKHKRNLSISHLGQIPTVHFKKGHIPWNKGSKGLQCLTDDQKLERSERFKKLKWYTNGEINVRKETCPEGFYEGRSNFKLGEEALKKRKAMNRIVSEETRRKLSIASSGKKMTDDQKKKCSESHMGKKASKETRKKMSEAHKAWWNNKKN